MTHVHDPQSCPVCDGKSVPGLSERQLKEHHDVLYMGYVNKLNEIEEKTPGADLSKTNATYSDIRELKREEVFATNGISLHEQYFAALGGSGVASGNIKKWIEEDFGSYEAWESEFKAMGLAARGWVVLAFNFLDGKFHNYLSDIHSDGVWGCSPILVLDVYEHAYFLDYGTNRKEYINQWSGGINWEWVNGIVEHIGIDEARKMAADAQ